MNGRARDTSRWPLDTTTDVETPEHVRFRHRAAGPARRALAYLVDLVIRAGVGFVVLVLLASVGMTEHGVRGASTGFALLLLFALEWCYYVLFETLWSGRSPGKRALKLRVVKEGGTPINFLDCVLRNLLRAADFLPGGYAIGVLVMARDERFRRLGDLVAGTMVVVEERARLAEPLRLSPPPTAEELEVIPQRPPLSSDELEAIELFLRRRGTLSPAREAELAQMIAPQLARRLSLRLHDASRFLALLHYRATERSTERRK
jgi:uncharacterized RDD family membrane protein YckC